MTKENNGEVYSSERQALMKSEYHAADQFDKTLITLSTGSLYLSFYFVKDIEEIQGYCLLAIGWFFFVISIISILVSFLLSEKAFRKQLEILDKKFSSKDKSYVEENKYNNWIGCTQKISFFSLILGIIMLTIFYFFNLQT